jgi:hypothetical protein
VLEPFGMNALDRLIATPRLVEIDHVDLGAPPERVWEAVRHGELARSPFARALFVLRTLPDRYEGVPVESFTLRLDELCSSPEHPGFQILAEDAPREVVVGAIGKVWHPAIQFVHVGDATAYAAFDAPDFVKVAWALRVVPEGEGGAHLDFELRVDATDEVAWRKFRRYFTVIGPASRFIRKPRWPQSRTSWAAPGRTTRGGTSRAMISCRTRSVR